MLNIRLILLLLAVLFSAAAFQYSFVWLNEELLLVISFLIFYTLAYKALSASIDEFFLDRMLGIQKNPFLTLKLLGLRDLKIQNHLQYYNVLNIISVLKYALENYVSIISNNKLDILAKRKLLIEKELSDLIKSETTYKNEVLGTLSSISYKNTVSNLDNNIFNTYSKIEFELKLNNQLIPSELVVLFMTLK